MKKILEKTYYPVIFHIEEKGYSTIVPDLDGCFSQGDNMTEAVAMTQEAIGLMLEEYLEKSVALPKPSNIESITSFFPNFTILTLLPVSITVTTALEIVSAERNRRFSFTYNSLFKLTLVSAKIIIIDKQNA